MLAEQGTFTHEGEYTNKTIEKDKTLLVDGPALVTLISGKAEVFGFTLCDSRRIVIRDGKRLPFTVLEKAQFDIALGEEAGVTEVKDGTIPLSWQFAVDALRKISTRPATAIVVGGVDSGKSSLCTYLANCLVNEHCQVAILDEDIGQSDIGPPCTVAYAIVRKPVTDLFDLKPEKVVFVGATSPIGATDRTVEATATLALEVRAKADLVIVNTDGWVLGDDAIAFKKRLAEAVKPDVIFFLLQLGESIPPHAFAKAFEAFKVERVDSPTFAKERNIEKRRAFRNFGILKYLENARVRVFPLSNVRVEGAGSDSVLQLPEIENLLIGLYDDQRRFLGIGIIRDIDIGRRALKLYTAIEQMPAIVSLGRVRLDENLHEICTN